MGTRYRVCERLHKLKLYKYFLKYQPLDALSKIGCNDVCIELVRIGVGCQAKFPDFQISFGLGASPASNMTRHTFTWFLDLNGRPRFSVHSDEINSNQYYVGLWLSRNAPRPDIVAPPGTVSETEWIWATDSRKKLNKGALNAFFGNE